ncbi:site-specific integrase [Vibrio methylphosphonaticus]|uniref:site-specific integrase n=1 Tax=Vibrio methylphosphonaticus TaxID=2946866 RepID=UPI002029EE2C|nr:site-specific integrase [Vibrio methylphosphonaticus]MCL9775494.1 site-specific integrase [Vibrio methylphosphonaticus]
MAHIRIRPNGRIQFDLHLYGQRFREGTKLMATPKNLRLAQATLKQMNAEIDLNTFQYRDYFPDSKKVDLFERLQRNKHPDRLYPFFNDFAAEWFERKKGAWKHSYQSVVWNNLTSYLIPHFGNTLVSEVSLSQVDFFRQSLQDMRKPNGDRKLSNKRINNLLWPLIAIISLASEEHQFAYPFRRYRSLKEEKAESKPLTKEEVDCFLTHCDESWKDYFLLRFLTGMRSCEVHGLHWEHIDFEYRLIRIRQNFVNGELCDVKTQKSRRELKMSDPLCALLQRQWERRTDSPFVFPSQNGNGLSTQYVSKHIWHPILKKAGLKPRRAYETRHTSAVLHISAHENPLYISHMLGHSDTKLLFDVYAPYVMNASRQDGKAFDALMGGLAL